MDSDPLPTTTSPCPTDNAEVLSQEAPSPGETVPEAPQGDLPNSGSRGSKAPEGSEFGPQPNTAPEPPVVLDSGRRPPSKRGKPPMPVTFVHPEAPNNRLGALRSASIDEEHRTIMSAVVQKIQSAKSGLTEAVPAYCVGDLCPSRGIGQSAGSASQCFHRRGAPHYHECGDPEGSVRQEQID